jgi:hypothetical protein
MVPVTGDGNGEGDAMHGVWSFSEGNRGRGRGSSTVPKADDTMKSGTAVEEAEGGCCPKVEDDQRKMGRWAECTVKPNY